MNSRTLTGLDAARPSASELINGYFAASDTKIIYKSDGNTWVATDLDYDSFLDAMTGVVIVSNKGADRPVSAQTIRAAAVLTSAYVASSVFQALGRAKAHLDFIFSAPLPTNAGSVIAYLQVSDDNSNWYDVMSLVADTSATTDNKTDVVPATHPVRQLVSEFNCIKVDYLQAATPAKRITLDLGYGGYYRLQVRAANAGGVNTDVAAGDLPTLQINATLQ